MLKNDFKASLHHLRMNKAMSLFIAAALSIIIASATLISTKELTKAELQTDKSVSERSELPLLHFVSVVWRDITNNY